MKGSNFCSLFMAFPSSPKPRPDSPSSEGDSTGGLRSEGGNWDSGVGRSFSSLGGRATSRIAADEGAARVWWFGSCGW